MKSDIIYNLVALPPSIFILLFLLESAVAFSPQTTPVSFPTNFPPTQQLQPQLQNPQPTPPPLLKRAPTPVDPTICGWLGGISSLAAVCSAGSSCIRDTVNKVVGCCGVDGAGANGRCRSGVYTSCVDFRNPASSWLATAVGGIGVQENGIFTCTGTTECYRNSYPDGYFQYGCGASSFATTVETTFQGQPTDVILPLVFTTVFYSSMPDAPSINSTSMNIMFSTTPSSTIQTHNSTQVTSSTGAAFIPTSSITNTLPTRGPETTDSTPKLPTLVLDAPKQNTAAIAGGIIGGINGLALLAVLTYYLIRRKRKQDQKKRRLTRESLSSSLNSSNRVGGNNGGGGLGVGIAITDNKRNSRWIPKPSTSVYGVTRNGSENSQMQDRQSRRLALSMSDSKLERERQRTRTSIRSKSSEIDDFSRGYRMAVRSVDLREPDIEPVGIAIPMVMDLRPSMLGDPAGFAMGGSVDNEISASEIDMDLDAEYDRDSITFPPAPNGLRASDRNRMTLEPYNLLDGEDRPVTRDETSEVFSPRASGWVPKALRTSAISKFPISPIDLSQIKAPSLSNFGADIQNGRGRTSDDDGRNFDVLDDRNADNDIELDIPPRSPLRKVARDSRIRNGSGGWPDGSSTYRPVDEVLLGPLDTPKT